MSQRNMFLAFIAAVSLGIIWKYFSQISVCPVTPVSEHGQQLSLREKLKAIDMIISTIFECYPHFPGLSLAIVSKGKVIRTHGYGHTDLGRLTKCDGKTTFGLGSLSKAFTATLALKLLKRHRIIGPAHDTIGIANVMLCLSSIKVQICCDKAILPGAVSLGILSDGKDDKYFSHRYSQKTRVVDILGPNFRFHDEILTQHATIGDLLSHRLGLPRYNFIRFQPNFTRDYLPVMFCHMKQRLEFRSSFVYNNLGYGLVSYIIEQLENKSFEELMKEHVFKPVGMNSTFFRSRHWPNESVASPHVECGGNSQPLQINIFRHFGRLGSSGSVMSTAEDIARWLHVLLHNGTSPEGIQVIPASVITETQKSRAIIPLDHQWMFSQPFVPVSFVSTQVTAGWRKGFYRGYPMITHTGTTIGYSAMITMIPSHHLGIYSSFNSFDPHFYTRFTLHAYIADIFLGVTPWLNRSTVCSFLEPWMYSQQVVDNFNKAGSATRKLTDYIGTYDSGPFGQVTITLIKTYLHLNYGILNVYLYPNKQPDTFLYHGHGKFCFSFGEATFQYNSSISAIVSITLVGFEKKDPPVFYKL